MLSALSKWFIVGNILCYVSCRKRSLDESTEVTNPDVVRDLAVNLLMQASCNMIFADLVLATNIEFNH